MRKNVFGIDFSQAQSYTNGFVKFPQVFECSNQSVHRVEHRRIVSQAGTKGDYSSGQIAVGDLVDRIVVTVFWCCVLIRG